jgi:hypothetical protein
LLKMSLATDSLLLKKYKSNDQSSIAKDASHQFFRHPMRDGLPHHAQTRLHDDSNSPLIGTLSQDSNFPKPT